MMQTKTRSEIGKYRLLEFLGGGMSHVYRAQDTVLGRTVAVKVLTDSACAQADAKARFLAEARLASNLTHDHILGIYDFGEDEENRPFMVMEFLQGQDLRQAIREGQTGDAAGKLRIALQIAHALRYIHTRKIIHRDIKPENVYVTSGGTVKLMDFGIAKLSGLNMTRAGFVLGTPYYMAPEQVMGKELTPQADVYSFGVLLFELFTGVKPITGDTVERIFYLILNEPVDLSPLAKSDAPAAICDLVARCTAKDPAARPNGFDPICELLEGRARVADREPKSEPPSESNPPGKRRWRRTIASVAAVLALSGGFLGFAWQSYHRVESDLNTAAAEVVAGGIAGDGLIEREGLQHLRALRSYADRLDTRRNSLPLAYRIGAFIWGDLYPTAQRLYDQRFRTFLSGPAQTHAVKFLRDLPAAPGPLYGQVYDALKFYEVTTEQPDKSDARFLAGALLRWWEAGANPGADREEAARQEFEAYAEERRPKPTSADAVLVAAARRYLNQFAGLDRVYARLLDDAERHTAALNFNRQFAGSDQVLRETYEVPGAFTKAGWDFTKDAVAHSERYFAGEPWVTGKRSDDAANDAHLADELMARYQDDYILAWRRYLGSGSLVRFTNVKDAAAKLDLFAGDSSPITLWLAAAAQNTAVDASAVSTIFQPVEAAVSAGQAYRELMAGLASVVRKGSGDEAVAQSLQGVRQLESAFHRDLQGQADAQVAHMLEEPATVTRMVLHAGGPSDWNAIGANLSAQLKPVLSKYPFVRAAKEQATIQEIAAIFQPKEGALWKIYETSLAKLISRQGTHFIAHASSGLNVNTAFLAFLDRAAAFSKGLFGESDGQMRVRYTLRPVIPPDVDWVKITVDGQSATFKTASPAKSLIWPGTGMADMHVTVRYKNKSEFNWSKQGTPWAIFLFLDNAVRRQGSQMEVPLSKSATMWFEVTAAPAVFDAGFFSGMNSVAEIVKQ